MVEKYDGNFSTNDNQKLFGKGFPIFNRNDLIYRTVEPLWNEKDFKVHIHLVHSLDYFASITRLIFIFTLVGNSFERRRV